MRNWEKWPFKVIYFPLTFVWAWYMLRSRSFWFFTPSNPTITFGGFQGEGKREMYDQLPLHTFPKTIYIEPDVSFEIAVQEIESTFKYPFVVKPENGMMGLLFRIIDNKEQLKRYHSIAPEEYIVQEFNDYPIEVSIFYYRYPTSKTGTVSGFIMKEYLQVKGDGLSNLKTLIEKNGKANEKMEEMQAKHGANFNVILPDGEVYFLSYAGNHNRGARFINLYKEIDQNLLNLCDYLSTDTNKFYYGRFDIKCKSVADLKQQKNYTILEYNGAGAEPNHIYDCNFTLWQAYSEILKHWKALFEISKYNNKIGYKYWTTKQGWQFFQQSKKILQRHKLKDVELGSL
jgi:hypothetical protein